MKEAKIEDERRKEGRKKNANLSLTPRPTLKKHHIDK
jgi:hypothetical protein